jgi:chromosome partitioning protein
MQSLAFMTQKGGSGKTTLAVHVAVAAEEAGERVVIVDTDPQRSASTWGDSRQQDTPVIAPVAAAELGHVMAAARHDAMTLCIIDTAPHAAPDAVRVAQLADLIIIPCRPAAFDLAAAGSAVDIVRAAGAHGVFVLSACPFRAPEIAETRTVLEGNFGLPIAPVTITDRRAFARAVATGRAVTEFESEGKAAEEIRELWHWLKQELTHDAQSNRARRIHPQEHAA